MRVHNLQRRNTAIEPAEEVEEEGWMTVYLDMMTLMLVMLVVMLSFAGRNQQASTTEPLVSEPVAASNIVADSEPPEKPAPETSLDTSGLGDDIEVIINEKTVSFRISSEIIFAEAQADLSIDGTAYSSSCCRYCAQVSIRLPSPDTPTTGRFAAHASPSNCGNFGARAGSVVRYLEANGIPSSRLTATGYADTRPVADNDSAASRAKNRRVELILQKQD